MSQTYDFKGKIIAAKKRIAAAQKNLRRTLKEKMNETLKSNHSPPVEKKTEKIEISTEVYDELIEILIWSRDVFRIKDCNKYEVESINQVLKKLRSEQGGS